MNKFEILDDIAGAVRRIKELKSEGVDERDIHLYVDSSPSSELRANYAVHIHKGEGNMFQKFTSAFTGHSAEEKITDEMRLTEDEANEYHQAIEDGKFVIQVDQSAKLEALDKEPIEQVGIEEDDSVHIDLSKRDDY